MPPRGEKTGMTTTATANIFRTKSAERVRTMTGTTTPATATENEATMGATPTTATGTTTGIGQIGPATKCALGLGTMTPKDAEEETKGETTTMTATAGSEMTAMMTAAGTDGKPAATEASPTNTFLQPGLPGTMTMTAITKMTTAEPSAQAAMSPATTTIPDTAATSATTTTAMVLIAPAPPATAMVPATALTGTGQGENRTTTAGFLIEQGTKCGPGSATTRPRGAEEWMIGGTTMTTAMATGIVMIIVAALLLIQVGLHIATDLLPAETTSGNLMLYPA